MKNKKLFAILTLLCFLFTLMPVAAFAAETGVVDAETSSFVAVDGNQTVSAEKAANTGIKFELDLSDKDEDDATTGDVYVWAVNENGTVTSALEVAGADSGIKNVVKLGVGAAGEVVVKLTRAGEYTVYAGVAANDAPDSVSDLNKFACTFSTIKVKDASVNPDNYTAALGSGKAFAPGALNTEKTAITVVPNNVYDGKYTVTFYKNDVDEDGDLIADTDKPLKGKTVAIETNSSSIEVNKESAVTNTQGKIDFKVAASVEGDYEIDFTVDGVTWTVYVTVTNTSATYIETVTEPTAPLAQYTDLEDEVEFQITDINGNEVTVAGAGMVGIDNNNVDAAAGEKDYEGKYVVLTEKPEASNIESEDLTLVYNGSAWELVGFENMDVEGTYSVKVILDNGAYATASWEVKRFQTPVKLIIGTSTNVVELGAAIGGELKYIDANGVVKAAKDAELVATGYAVASVAGKANAEGKFSITAKSDEKYVGATITATAVSEKYDLVATKEFKVAEGASDIAFVDKTADVNVNNKLEWHVVDASGTRVALIGGIDANVKAEVNYVVLDKPADAKVSVNDQTVAKDLTGKGIGKMALTSNKVGNVTVQVILKATYPPTSNAAQQVKYYTGTQIFAVGTAGVGDVVVMSIGSNEIVINDAKATIDAAPIVENNRTFVPFRALAEAFGATVAYDEATQAVTAELNGVTVVMTIGSAEYTVNGEAKTADVAPFINGSRTMVPVRFAAEAFGIKVIPTYDENGATADILFNL